jgi:YHS domain-containing protein
MNDIRSIDPNEDPVCGMRVDPDAARAQGLTYTHEGREYAFCGKGCLLDFKDEPAKYLAQDYRPSM